MFNLDFLLELEIDKLVFNDNAQEVSQEDNGWEQDKKQRRASGRDFFKIMFFPVTNTSYLMVFTFKKTSKLLLKGLMKSRFHQF